MKAASKPRPNNKVVGRGYRGERDAERWRSHRHPIGNRGSRGSGDHLIDRLVAGVECVCVLVTDLTVNPQAPDPRPKRLWRG